MNKKLILITALSGLLSFNLFAKTNEETASDAISDSQQKSTGTEFGKVGPGFGVNGLYLLKPHKKIDEMISKKSNKYSFNGKWYWDLSDEYAQKVSDIGYRTDDLPIKELRKFLSSDENKITYISETDFGNGWLATATAIEGKVYSFDAFKRYDTGSPNLVLKAIINELGEPNYKSGNSYLYYDGNYPFSTMESGKRAEIPPAITGEISADEMHDYFIHVDASKERDKVVLRIKATAPKKAFLEREAIDKRAEKLIRSLYDKRLRELKKESESEIIL